MDAGSTLSLSLCSYRLLAEPPKLQSALLVSLWLPVQIPENYSDSYPVTGQIKFSTCLAAPIAVDVQPAEYLITHTIHTHSGTYF